MTALSFMQSPPWQTAGWMMLHFVWVGGAIGLLAAAGRVLLRAARPEQRYAFALGSFAALPLSPAFILGYLLLNPPRYSSQPEVSLAMPAPVLESSHGLSVAATDPALSEAEPFPTGSVATQSSNPIPD